MRLCGYISSFGSDQDGDVASEESYDFSDLFAAIAERSA
jgi:hypothetical protein